MFVLKGKKAIYSAFEKDFCSIIRDCKFTNSSDLQELCSLKVRTMRLIKSIHNTIEERDLDSGTVLFLEGIATAAQSYLDEYIWEYQSDRRDCD